jgi:glucokinase
VSTSDDGPTRAAEPAVAESRSIQHDVIQHEVIEHGAAIGVDVGGTKCLGVVLDATGAVVHRDRRPTPSGGPALLATLAALIGDLATVAPRARPTVGVGVPGLVTSAGVLRAAPHLGDVADLDVRGRLTELLGRPVRVDNDATCATVAEWRVGAGRGHDDLVLVTLGTGIGGGIVAGGRLVRGRHGFAGEFGHMVVEPAGHPCPCGRRGCWERYASGSALGQLAREAALGGRAAAVVALAGGDPEAVRGEHVQAAARAGDPEAASVIDEFGRWVALGLVNLTNALDPARFVLGGGLASGADLYLDPIRRWFGELVYAPRLRPHPEVVFAHLDEDAGAIGAALLGDGD